MFCNRCGAGTAAHCKNVPCGFPHSGDDTEAGGSKPTSAPSNKSGQSDAGLSNNIFTPIDMGPYPDLLQSGSNAMRDIDAAERAQGRDSGHEGWYIDAFMKAEQERNSSKVQQSTNSGSSGVGPVVAFVAAAALVVFGVNSCQDNKPAPRTANDNAASTGPAHEPQGQNTPLKNYVKPDGQPVQLWADFKKSQLRLHIPEGACIEVLDKNHAFGMSSVTLQYNSGRYEHGLIEQNAKTRPAPECNNTMR